MNLVGKFLLQKSVNRKQQRQYVFGRPTVRNISFLFKSVKNFSSHKSNGGDDGDDDDRTQRETHETVSHSKDCIVCARDVQPHTVHTTECWEREYRQPKFLNETTENERKRYRRTVCWQYAYVDIGIHTNELLVYIQTVGGEPVTHTLLTSCAYTVEFIEW